MTRTISRPALGARLDIPASPGGPASRSSEASGRCTGSVTVNVLPVPCRLSTLTVPPSMSAKALVMDRPRPVPPNLRVVEASACRKRWNNCANWSAVMPMPVSSTSNTSVAFGPSPPSRRAINVTVPAFVNFAALLKRLRRTWRTLVMSECMVPRSSPSWSLRVLLFFAKSASTVTPTSSTVEATSNVSANTSIRPLSIFERSSTSLIRPSRWRALPSILRMSSRSSVASVPSSISSSSISL